MSSRGSQEMMCKVNIDHAAPGRRLVLPTFSPLSSRGIGESPPGHLDSLPPFLLFFLLQFPLSLEITLPDDLTHARSRSPPVFPTPPSPHLLFFSLSFPISVISQHTKPLFLPLRLSSSQNGTTNAKPGEFQKPNSLRAPLTRSRFKRNVGPHPPDHGTRQFRPPSSLASSSRRCRSALNSDCPASHPHTPPN